MKNKYENRLKQIRSTISLLDELANEMDVENSNEKKWVKYQAETARKQMVELQTMLKKLSMK